MGRREQGMTRGKKALLLVFLLSAGILLGGCNTVAGTAEGVAKGVASTAEGVGKDTVGLYGAIMKLDSWIRENLW